MKNNKRRNRIMAAVVVLIVVYAVYAHGRHKPLPPAPPTVTAERGDVIAKVSETGIVETANKIDIKSKVAGRILTLLVTEGEPVRAGQLIATVDRELIDPQIASAQAQLDQAKARLAQSVTTYNLQKLQTRSAIEQARANLASSKAHLVSAQTGARPQEVAEQQEAVARAQVSLDDTTRTLRRKQDLLAKGFVPQSDVDAAQVATDTARSNLATAKAALSLTQAGPRQVDVDEAHASVSVAQTQLAAAQVNAAQDEIRRSDVVQAQASVDQIKNQLAQLEVNVADTHIIAPAAGIVMKIYKHADEIVQSATTGFSDQQSLVATLGGRVDVKVSINEVDVAKIRLGMPTDVTVDALPDVALHGRVSTIAPASTNAYVDSSSSGGSGAGIAKFVVTIGVEQNNARLRPGMSANIGIITDKRLGVVTLPLDAVSSIAGSSGTLTVLGPLGKQSTRSVTIGLRNDVVAEIKSGLAAGDKVLLNASGNRRKMFDMNDNN